MGSVNAGAVETEMEKEAEAFLERCAASGDAAYGELKDVLARLHDPATRRQARAFLAALRRRQSGDEDDGACFFRRYGFRVRELLLHDPSCGLPITTLSTSSDYKMDSEWTMTALALQYLVVYGNPDYRGKIRLVTLLEFI